MSSLLAQARKVQVHRVIPRHLELSWIPQVQRPRNRCQLDNPKLQRPQNRVQLDNPSISLDNPSYNVLKIEVIWIPQEQRPRNKDHWITQVKPSSKKRSAG
jgi:hypothetical protein